MVARGGACVVAPGGGGCVVAPQRGHAWLLWGGMHGCSGGMHGIQQDMEIRSMSGRYASYWNAFLSEYSRIEMLTSGQLLIIGGSFELP